MWKRVAVATATFAVGVTAAGCGGTADRPAATSAAPAPADSGAPLNFPQCAAMTEDDLSGMLGLPGLRQVAANPLRCGWETGGGGYAVVFAWFRGSSLTERRDQVTLGPAVDVRIAGHPGFTWSGAQGCEIAAGSGGGDFIDWTVTAGAAAAGSPCAALPRLAAATLAKAG
ncbi:DUF3558 family protein [Nocardia stercoris]|uniref:DUF3558 family protein n=1 Tax=Nocardia stercoris TaxID=2483361 RepID=UPI001319EE5D|nr:DUF3558 family protein [Nocardia stercoris]